MVCVQTSKHKFKTLLLWFGAAFFIFISLNTACGPYSKSAPTTIKTLTITPKSLQITNGLTVQFTAMGTYLDNTTADVTKFITWSSSHLDVASISTDGLASTFSAGTSTITASYLNALGNSISDSVTLSVTPAHTLISLTLSSTSPSSISSDEGSQQFTCTGNYADGLSQDLTYSVSWQSSNSSVATISNTGLVSAVSGGTTSISASLGSVISATVSQTVSKAWLYFVNAANATLQVCKVSGNTLSNCTPASPTNVSTPTSIVLNAAKTMAYISNSGSSQITTCDVNSVLGNGSLTNCTVSAIGSISGLAPNNLTAITMSPSGAYVYANDNTNNRILYCPTGNFTTLSCSIFGSSSAPANFNNINPPSFTPNGAYFYVPNYNTNSISTCKTPTGGSFATCSTVDGVTGLSGNAGGTAVHPSGTHLYITVGSNIVYCAINSSTGTLSNCQNAATSAGVMLNGSSGTITFNRKGTYAFVGDWGATRGMLICHVASDKSFDSCTRVTGATLGISPANALYSPFYSP